MLLEACKRSPPDRAFHEQEGDRLRGPGDGVDRHARRRQTLARHGADRRRRAVVEACARRSSATASRGSRATSPIAPCCRSTRCEEDLHRPNSVVLWARPEDAPRPLSAAAGRALQPGGRVPQRPLRGRLERLRRHRGAQRCVQGRAPTVKHLLDKINVWKMWVLCDREPVKQLGPGPRHAARRRRASDAAIPGARRLHGDRGRRRAGATRSRRPATTTRRRSRPTTGALPAHGARAALCAHLRRVLPRQRRARGSAQRASEEPKARRRRRAWLRGHGMVVRRIQA